MHQDRPPQCGRKPDNCAADRSFIEGGKALRSAQPRNERILAVGKLGYMLNSVVSGRILTLASLRELERVGSILNRFCFVKGIWKRGLNWTQWEFSMIGTGRFSGQ